MIPPVLHHTFLTGGSLWRAVDASDTNPAFVFKLLDFDWIWPRPSAAFWRLGIGPKSGCSQIAATGSRKSLHEKRKSHLSGIRPGGPPRNPSDFPGTSSNRLKYNSMGDGADSAQGRARRKISAGVDDRH